MSTKLTISSWFKSGAPGVWMSAAAVSISMMMVLALLLIIIVRGMGHFWPADIVQGVWHESHEADPIVIMGEQVEREAVLASRLRESGVRLDGDAHEVERLLIKTGNRDVSGIDFLWLIVPHFEQVTKPDEAMVLERMTWGNFYGTLVSVKENGQEIASGPDAHAVLLERLDRTIRLRDKIRSIEKGDIGAINYGMERLRLKQRRLELDGEDTPEALAELDREKEGYDQEYKGYQQQLLELNNQIRRDALVAKTSAGVEAEISLSDVVRAYWPNTMSVSDKIFFYLDKLWEFVSDDPREANTEGGIFPAIFGTVMMVLLMTVVVTPFGVIAAIYLREYARQGTVTRLVRIAVNNLAGVPSIVYGVFGLGFFVYFLGGSIDQLFFPEALPAPTFGTPGLMWASLTLAILTVPVVIVSTEEGLSRIPKAIREGSLALGATKAETLWRTVIPMASPSIMTGMILAIARAAGEVAPLMLVGVVKLAPSLPLDLNAPFLHLDRKFMHLGFHIYDVGFQSPNVEAARPLVYATSFLLVVVIVVLNLAAIAIRNHLREKYRALEN